MNEHNFQTIIYYILQKYFLNYIDFHFFRDAKIIYINF